jgi:hypothetical protein
MPAHARRVKGPLTKEGYLESRRRINRGLLFVRSGFVPFVVVAALAHLSTIALAAAPTAPSASGPPPTRAVHAASAPQDVPDQRPTLALPPGGKLCPASGPGAACEASRAAVAAPGQSSLPDGLTQCPADPAKSGLTSIAACDEITLPSLASPAPALANVRALPSPVKPSVPQASLATQHVQRPLLTLNASSATPHSGDPVVLTATATASVTGTPSAIEIFDRTTGTLAGACMVSGQCQVAYTAESGLHSFDAFVMPPAATAPEAGAGVASNSIRVTWLAVSVNAGFPAAVGPGKAINLTASTSVDVGALGFVLMFWDTTSNKRLTYCSSGTSCSTLVSEPAAGSHSIVAYVARTATATPSSGVNASSSPVSPTWLSVRLSADAIAPKVEGTVYLTATANTDLTNTPWNIGIYDEAGNLIGKPCKAARVCTAQARISGSATPSFYAAIGAEPVQRSARSSVAGQLLPSVFSADALVNLQAKSAAVKPARLLWGVDSCKPLTGDSAASSGLYPQVSSMLGTPDFWGRYLTTTGNCPGISSTEVAATAKQHLGILPIYNDYDCSAVSGYSTAQGYAANAASAATGLGIPQGTVLVIDIEPPGPWCSGGVDSAFVAGWHDGLVAAGYAPGFYGDGTASSTFGTAWCGAVAAHPEIGADSYLWSFEPSLAGSYTKASSPAWQPNSVACPGHMAAWQYELSSGSAPDVDSDEALSSTPLWYP